MFDLSNAVHHKTVVELGDILCNKTQNTDKSFFRAEVAYFLGKMASTQRATISTKDRGDIPVNIYAIALATSGYGKGHSVHIMEDTILSGFRTRFLEETLPAVAEKNLWELANEKALKLNTDPSTEFEHYKAAFDNTGAYRFTFDSATVPAIKQLREKLLMSGAGSLNLQIDEIGSNLLGATEVLNSYLELYDQGIIKPKLIKNTKENMRADDIEGKTPANMLIFGTPNKVFDGAVVEDLYLSFLETGFARRCIYGFGTNTYKAHHKFTAEEMYEQLTSSQNDTSVAKWSTLFTTLGGVDYFNWRIELRDAEAIKLLEYKIHCEKLADALPEHEEIKKAELVHRYFKALKLAGAFAFTDKASFILESTLLSAILLVEESGEAFNAMLNREKTYVKLAKYIANVGTEVTHADLVEALPFYKSGKSAREELMSLAIAWGYKQHILIKRKYLENIDLFSGSALQKTDLEKITVSYSTDWAHNYLAEEAPFDQLHVLTKAPNMKWVNHAFKDNHRHEDNIIQGTSIVVFDIDGGVDLSLVHELLKDFIFFTHTTKRHTPEENRFRLVLPLNYVVKMDVDEYREFVDNIRKWLPFEVDPGSNQISRAWSSYEHGTYYYNMKGELLDALTFIPRTTRNESFEREYSKVSSLDSLERWFAQKMSSGNRNNTLLKYAMVLVDSGMDLASIRNTVINFNKKIQNPLDVGEIENTILVTVAKKYPARKP